MEIVVVVVAAVVGAVVKLGLVVEVDVVVIKVVYFNKGEVDVVVVVFCFGIAIDGSPKEFSTCFYNVVSVEVTVFVEGAASTFTLGNVIIALGVEIADGTLLVATKSSFCKLAVLSVLGN